MENNNQFSISQILGSKIYRYVDGNGVKGKIHFSTTKLTPIEVYSDENGKSYVFVDGEPVEVKSMEELDSINNAFNNHTKSLDKIMPIPSAKIAQTNPELYLKTLEAIRYAIVFKGHEKVLKHNSSPLNFSAKADFYEYAKLDACVKKMARIKNATEKSQAKPANSEQEKI